MVRPLNVCACLLQWWWLLSYQTDLSIKCSATGWLQASFRTLMSYQTTCLSTSAQSLRQQLLRGSPVLKQPSLQLRTGESGYQEAKAT